MRLIPAQFIKPYRKSNKNDLLDAEAIAEVVTKERSLLTLLVILGLVDRFSLLGSIFLELVAGKSLQKQVSLCVEPPACIISRMYRSISRVCGEEL